MIGASLPSWISQVESIKDNRLHIVGYSEMSADRNEVYISKAALMDAEVKLINDAPTDFRVITQNALVSAGIDSSEFMQIQTKLTEVIALGGLKQGESTCRKWIRYGETRTSVMKGCWHQASASLVELRKAYLFTLQKKYGSEKAHKFDDVMKQELEKVNNHRRYDNEDSKASNLPSVQPNNHNGITKND
jgi:hypothetical protein